MYSCLRKTSFMLVYMKFDKFYGIPPSSYDYLQSPWHTRWQGKINTFSWVSCSFAKTKFPQFMFLWIASAWGPVLTRNYKFFWERVFLVISLKFQLKGNFRGAWFFFDLSCPIFTTQFFSHNNFGFLSICRILNNSQETPIPCLAAISFVKHLWTRAILSKINDDPVIKLILL